MKVCTFEERLSRNRNQLKFEGSELSANLTTKKPLRFLEGLKFMFKELTMPRILLEGCHQHTVAVIISGAISTF